MRGFRLSGILAVLTSQSTHPSLLDRVRSLDDHAAWREFEARYRELILRYALRRGLEAHDAEDVLQAVLLRLARRLPSFEYRPEVGSFRSYLRRVVQNEIFHAFARPEPARLRVEDLEDTLPDDTGDDELWIEEWTQHHYRLAMAAVREDFPARSLGIFERLLAGDAPEGLARAHGISVEAVYKVKQRVRERLRERIERQVHEEEFRERRA